MIKEMLSTSNYSMLDHFNSVQFRKLLESSEDLSINELNILRNFLQENKKSYSFITITQEFINNKIESINQLTIV